MKFFLKFSKFSFQYTQPIVVGSQKLVNNEYLHLDVFYINEKVTSIDLITLPNFHFYSINQLQQHLDHFFGNREFNFNTLDFYKPLFGTTEYKEKIDSQLLYFTELILLKLINTIRNDLILFDEGIPILTNTFLRPAPLSTQKMRKIKIRPSDPDETHLKIANYLNLSTGTKLRLDGNQCFTAQELIVYLNKIKKNLNNMEFCSIDYIEDPLIDISTYVQIFKEFKIPLGVDESINFDNVEKHLELNYVKTLVLKPSLLGISTTFKIITLAQTKYLKDCVISSTYESGSAFLGHLFLAQKLPFICHGLDTLHLLPPNLSVLDKNVTFIY